MSRTIVPTPKRIAHLHISEQPWANGTEGGKPRTAGWRSRQRSCASPSARQERIERVPAGRHVSANRRAPAFDHWHDRIRVRTGLQLAIASATMRRRRTSEMLGMSRLRIRTVNLRDRSGSHGCSGKRAVPGHMAGRRLRNDVDVELAVGGGARRKCPARLGRTASSRRAGRIRCRRDSEWDLTKATASIGQSR
jgi:hypothetical protein